jgi:Ser/Thr protein kinase RdoA (MazF antagonist)
LRTVPVPVPDRDTSARAETLAAYERIRPLDAAESSLIVAFTSSSSLLIGEQWIRWHYIEGRRFDDPLAVEQGIARGLAHVERLAITRRTGPWKSRSGVDDTT